MRQYSPQALGLGGRFSPFAVETFGTLGRFASNIMHDLARYAKESFSVWSSSSVLSSLAILIQKGNAAVLAHGCLMEQSSIHK